MNPRNRCPVCGYEFEEVSPTNICPRHSPTEMFYAEELVGADDDVAYDV